MCLPVQVHGLYMVSVFSARKTLMKGNVWEQIGMVREFGGVGAVVEGSRLGEELYDSSYNLHQAKGLVDVIVRAL